MFHACVHFVSVFNFCSTDRAFILRSVGNGSGDRLHMPQFIDCSPIRTSNGFDRSYENRDFHFGCFNVYFVCARECFVNNQNDPMVVLNVV